MAYVDKCYSRKTGKIINYKWTAVLGRENGKLIRTVKRVEPYGLTPAKELKKQQEDADEWEKQERAEYEKQHGDSAEEKIKEKKLKENITLESFIDDHWMPKSVKKPVKKPHTPDTIAFYTNMSNDIKDYFKENKPRLKLSQIDKEDVLDYLRYMQNDAKTKKGKPYSATTIQHHFSTLRNILEYAVYIDYIKENPCKKVRPDDRPKRDRKNVEFLDTDEAIRFLSCLDSEKEIEYWKSQNRDPLFWKCLINVLITTGLRRGELCGLQWGDLDRKKMVLNVCRNVTVDTTNKTEKDTEKKIHIGELKGRGKDESRKVPVSKYVIELLDSYKENQEEKFGAALLPNAYIFCRDNNAYIPLYPTEPTRLLSKYIKRHKLPNVSPHDLRHTAGFLAIESGASVKEIQSLLGHRDPSVTLKFYVGITEQVQQRTAAGIDNLLHPKAEEKKA